MKDNWIFKKKKEKWLFYFLQIFLMSGLIENS